MVKIKGADTISCSSTFLPIQSFLPEQYITGNFQFSNLTMLTLVILFYEWLVIGVLGLGYLCQNLTCILYLAVRNNDQGSLGGAALLWYLCSSYVRHEYTGFLLFSLHFSFFVGTTEFGSFLPSHRLYCRIYCCTPLQ